jgi:hypothetical protein
MASLMFAYPNKIKTMSLQLQGERTAILPCRIRSVKPNQKVIHHKICMPALFPFLQAIKRPGRKFRLSRPFIFIKIRP